MSKKKKLLLGIVATSLASLSLTEVQAALDGFYLGGQFGWGNIHQNNISRGEMNTLLNAAFGNNNYSMTSFTTSGGSTGVAGRLYGGYQFNVNWAGELGWSKFSTMTTNARAQGINGNSALSYNAKATGNIHASALDLVAKWVTPLKFDFSFYAKLGAAYLMESINDRAKVVTGGTNLFGKNNNSVNRFYPTFGLGLAYDITSYVVTDLSWNRIQRVGGNNNVESTDLLSVGLDYHFG